MSCYKMEKHLLYGGDYNPEQWPREVWEEDMRLMKKAHINIVTLNVFRWAALQPGEDTYDFAMLDEIMEMVRDHGLKVCLATSTAAHPAWMAKRYPDILRTEYNGAKRSFGGRHNSCPNSPTYRLYAPRLAEKLAKRYRNFDNIAAWHISNEYGGECYCENCAAAFRVWLKEKYGTLDEVNRVFYTSFWGHTFYGWDEIVPPNLLSEHFDLDGMRRTMFQGITLDYMRFFSDSMLECYLLERDAVKAVTPDIPVTTNLMGAYKNLDYQKWAKHMDFTSYDNYPAPDDLPADVAFMHDMIRGIHGQDPFVLMEQTPSVTNWQPYNRLKRPGEMRLQSYQAIAHGADAVQFFQIRRGIGACEKFHGAIIDHVGTEHTRVYREAEALGRELADFGAKLVDGRTPAQTAIVFDWDTWWAVENSAGPSIRLRYVSACQDFYRAAFAYNLPVDIISVEDDLLDYKMVIAPLLYMTKDGFDEKIRSYVRSGGTFITTYFSGIVDEHDLVICGGYPGRLRDILGIWVEESDALREGESNAFCFDAKSYPADLLCDIMHLEGAKALAAYENDFYAKTPAVTENAFGDGLAYYIGAHSNAAFYEVFLKKAAAQAGIQPVYQTPRGVEASVRVNENGRYLFLLNHTATEQRVVLTMDVADLICGAVCRCGEQITLEPRGVRVLEIG